MKKLFILLFVIAFAFDLFGVAKLNDDVFSATYENLWYLDNTSYDGITASQQDVCDAAGNLFGFSVSTASIRFDTGYKLEWVGADMFIYNDGANSMTIDADQTLKLLATTELDFTGGILDINATDDIDIDTSDTTGGVAIATATSGVPISLGHTTSETTINDNGKVTGDFAVDGTSSLDEVDIDGATQIDNTVTVGTSGTSFDVKFWSDTAPNYFLWDESADKLILDGVSGADVLSVAEGNVLFSEDLNVTKDINVTTDLDVDGISNLDNTDIDGTFKWDGTTFDLNGTDDIDIDTSDTTGGVAIATGTSGVPISIGHTTSETTVNDNFSVTGDLDVDGATNLDAVTIAEASTVNAKLTLTSELDTSGNVKINANSGDYDFQVQTDGDNYAIMAEGSTDNVGIGDFTPDAKLHVHDTDASAYVTVLKIERTSGSTADNDENRIGFFYTDDAANQDEFARISMVAEDVTSTTEDGKLILSVIDDGTISNIVNVEDAGMLCDGYITTDGINYGDGTEGIADTYTMTLDPAPRAYAAGMMVTMKPLGANSGACTLNVNGLGAKSIITQSDAAPAASDLVTTGMAILVYNGTDFVLINPASTCD